MKVLFLGTPQFAIKPLQALLSHHDVVGVVCQADKKGNRNKLTQCAVKKFAISNNINVYDFDNINEHEKLLTELNADIFVTCAYGQFINRKIIAIPPHGIINIHGSLLPKYRGAAPVQWAIINGDKYSGVTLMRTVLQMDAGDTLISKRIEIDDTINAKELFEEMSQLSSQLIIDGLRLIENGNAIFSKQDELSATKCNKLTLTNTTIDWSQSAQNIHNLVRGCNDNPVATTYLNGVPVKIWQTQVEQSNGININYGTIISCDKKGIIVNCGIGSIKLLSLQFSGGNQLSYTDIVNGRKLIIGLRFTNDN